MAAIKANESFNFSQSDVDMYNSVNPSSKDIVKTPIQLLGSVYGTSSREDLKVGRQVAADIAVRRHTSFT